MCARSVMRSSRALHNRGFGNTMEEWGFLRGCRYVLHDRDTKFCASFRELIESGSIKTIRLPARSPNLNSFAERWVRSVKEECLSPIGR